MSGDFRLDSDNATHDLLENSFATVLLDSGFEVVFHLGTHSWHQKLKMFACGEVR